MKKLTVLFLCVLWGCSTSNAPEIDNVGTPNEIDSIKAPVGQSLIENEIDNLPTKISEWDYPVKPGMEKWKQLQSHEEMVNACQIPEKILLSLSTEDLTILCLQYPLLTDVFAFNFLSMGADVLFDSFNGIRELFKREEAPRELLKHYHYQMQVFKGVESFLPVWDLEFLLGFYAQKVDNLSKEDYQKILQSLLYGHEKEVLHYDPNFSDPFPLNFYARAHVIIKINPQCIERFPRGDMNNAFHSDRIENETMNIINELSYQLIK